MKTRFNKLVSILVIFAMLFSIAPTSVFAYSDVNAGALGGGKDSTVITAGGWTVDEDKFNGMLFSLYFAEGDWSTYEEYLAAENAGQVNWTQYGESRYMVRDNDANIIPKYFSNKTVVYRMGEGLTSVSSFYDTKDWNSAAFGHKWGNWVVPQTGDQSQIKNRKVLDDGFPEIMEVNPDPNKWIKFFTGFTSSELSGDKKAENWPNADLTNIGNVLDRIFARLTPKVTVEQFRNGIYVDEFGVTHHGIYKLYFEPFIQVSMNWEKYAMTIRDIWAWYTNYPNQRFLYGTDGKYYTGLPVAGTNPILNAGNNVHIVDNEKQINMLGHTGGKFERHFNFDKTKPFYQSAGVGVITGFPYGKKIDRPQLIKTYVSIDSVDADGNVTFKKARPTTIEEAPFYITQEGNYTDYPMFYDVEMPTDESSVAVLNDIFTTDKDLQISDLTEWVDTELITNTGNVRLQPTAEDIAGYKFGIVTGSDTFIEALNKSSEHEGDVQQGMDALMAYYDKIFELNINSSIEDVYFDEIGLGDVKYGTKQIVNAIEYTHHMSDVQPRLTDAEIAALDINDGAERGEKREMVKAGMLTKEDGVVKITDELLQQIAAETGTPVEIATPANHIVLRYIVKPNPSQVDLVEIRDKATDEVKAVYVGEPQPLEISGNTAKIKDPNVQGLDAYEEDPEVIEWVTNSEYPVIDMTDDLPEMSPNGQNGTTRVDIPNYPKDPTTHNLYVKWVIYEEEVLDFV